MRAKAVCRGNFLSAPFIVIQRCYILIDGSNFYYKLKDLGYHDLLNLNFRKFASLLADDHTIIKSRYYVGRIRQTGTKQGEKMLANQQKLFVVLKNHGFSYSLGYLLESDGVFHEKGVDVQIAVDMLVATYENLCDRIILVSSDTDLAPAIRKVQEKGKVVEYVGFSHQPSVAMLSRCVASHILSAKDIASVINPKVC